MNALRLGIAILAALPLGALGQTPTPAVSGAALSPAALAEPVALARARAEAARSELRALPPGISQTPPNMPVPPSAEQVQAAMKPYRIGEGL